jgi:hypothetical protein
MQCMESKCKYIVDQNTIVNLLSARDTGLSDSEKLMARF